MKHVMSQFTMSETNDYASYPSEPFASLISIEVALTKYSFAFSVVTCTTVRVFFW